MGRKTVPNTWPGDSEATVAEFVVCVERHTICRWKSVAAVDGFRRPDVCRRRGTEVRDQTKTRRQNTLVCSQRVSKLAASVATLVHLTSASARTNAWSKVGQCRELVSRVVMKATMTARAAMLLAIDDKSNESRRSLFVRRMTFHITVCISTSSYSLCPKPSCSVQYS